MRDEIREELESLLDQFYESHKDASNFGEGYNEMLKKSRYNFFCDLYQSYKVHRQNGITDSSLFKTLFAMEELKGI